MAKKLTVYQTDEQGVFVHAFDVPELPLEPGKFNVPYRAVLKAPVLKPGYRPVWHSTHCPVETKEFAEDGVWQLEDIPVTLYEVKSDGTPGNAVETTLAIVGNDYSQVPAGYVLTPPPTIPTESVGELRACWVTAFTPTSPMFKKEGKWVIQPIQQEGRSKADIVAGRASPVVKRT